MRKVAKKVVRSSTYTHICQAILCCIFGITIANARLVPIESSRQEVSLIAIDGIETYNLMQAFKARQGVIDLTGQRDDSRGQEK